MTHKGKARELSCKHKCEDCGLVCSNIRVAAIEMAEWKQQQVIEWLSLHAEMYGAFNHGKLNEMVEALKKAMGE